MRSLEKEKNKIKTEKKIKLKILCVDIYLVSLKKVNPCGSFYLVYAQKQHLHSKKSPYLVPPLWFFLTNNRAVKKN